MKLIELVEKNYPVLKKDIKVGDVLEIMRKEKIDRVLVSRDSGNIYAIATEWDIFEKLSTIRKFPQQPYNLPLSSVASYPLEYLYPESDLKTAIDMFYIRGFSSIPIIDDSGTYYGLITKTGLMSNFRDKIIKTKLKAEDIMDYPKGLIDIGKSIRNAQNKLRLGGYSTLIVHSNRRYLGVVTALDIAKRIFYIRKTFPPKDWDTQINKLYVADVMRKDYNTATLDEGVEVLLNYILENKQKMVPIVDDNEKVIGIVSRRHLLRLLKV